MSRRGFALIRVKLVLDIVSFYYANPVQAATLSQLVGIFDLSGELNLKI